tara:strand:+ start:51 stop:1205 length:1155 start_codon:yes stop_codon:yes gene_type:complete
MSTLKVGGIRGVSASSDAVTVANDGTCTANITSVGGSQLSNRRVNRNGNFIVSQKNADTEITLGSSGDRWIDMIQTFLHNTATFKAQRVSDAPAGFQYSAKHTVHSADGSVANSDEAMFIHRMEGFDTAKFAYGTSGAKQITVSFYVKSSLTGDFSFAAQTGGRNYVNEYTINSADTWERKSFTLPALTTGTHHTTTGAGLSLIWDLGSGDDYATSTLGSWVTASNLYRATGSARLSTNASATWQITGIQVEEGTVATDFEHRSVNNELAMCYRYFYMLVDGDQQSLCIGHQYATNSAYGILPLPSTMRATPTLYKVVGSAYFRLFAAGSYDQVDDIALSDNGTKNGKTIQVEWIDNGVNTSVGQPLLCRSNNAACRVGFSAEL